MITNDKNIEKFNERMKVGRYERQVKQSLNERGKVILKQQPLDKKNHDSIQDELSNEENIDNNNSVVIEFEGRQIRVNINEGDNLESLAARVCEENCINEGMKEIVKELIEREFN